MDNLSKCKLRWNSTNFISGIADQTLCDLMSRVRAGGSESVLSCTSDSGRSYRAESSHVFQVKRRINKNQDN